MEDAMQVMKEILTQINDLSGAALQALMEGEAGAGAGAPEGPGGGPDGPPQGPPQPGA